MKRFLLSALAVALVLSGPAAAQSPPPAPAQGTTPAPAPGTPASPAQGSGTAATPPASIDEQVTNDILNRASRDGRFGAPVAGSLGVKPAWAAGYDLRWMDFNFSGGRRARIYHITYPKDPSQRLTIFLDLDTNQWTGWERVPR